MSFASLSTDIVRVTALLIEILAAFVLVSSNNAYKKHPLFLSEVSLQHLVFGHWTQYSLKVLLKLFCKVSIENVFDTYTYTRASIFVYFLACLYTLLYIMYHL